LISLLLAVIKRQLIDRQRIMSTNKKRNIKNRPKVFASYWSPHSSGVRMQRLSIDDVPATICDPAVGGA
jgi:hypothetical protein